MNAQIRAVQLPDRAATLAKLHDARWDHEQHARLSWLGRLVMSFTNDELHVIAESLSIDETDTCRALGLLGPDEGFDGHTSRAASSIGDDT